jgi:hypothetical protein
MPMGELLLTRCPYLVLQLFTHQLSTTSSTKTRDFEKESEVLRLPVVGKPGGDPGLLDW